MESRVAICRECGHTEIIEASKEAWALYDGGTATLQRCFPELSADVREMLSALGICGKCFDKIFE